MWTNLAANWRRARESARRRPLLFVGAAILLTIPVILLISLAAPGGFSWLELGTLVLLVVIQLQLWTIFAIAMAKID